MKILVVIILLTLSGCTSTNISDAIVKIGKDTYQVTQSIHVYSIDENKMMIAASNYCSNDSKNLFVTKQESIAMGKHRNETKDTLTFLCLNDDDPRYKEASPESNPDLIIENR